MPPKIEICIATFKRAALLRKLLDSLLHQETEGKFTYSIIVSDNDANRTAEPVVRDYIDTGMKIIYDVEPKQNMPEQESRCFTRFRGLHCDRR
jgi:glycosyltransferase involved in cell wall biosynthesis